MGDIFCITINDGNALNEAIIEKQLIVRHPRGRIQEFNNQLLVFGGAKQRLHATAHELSESIEYIELEGPRTIGSNEYASGMIPIL